ncbi:MAG: phosphoribosylglycinamide formyltransferase [Proteobacteria bacterium]|nr:phosphoribosylglycinamide formyltransferase [Pseudomonadota bacterium]
MTRAKIAVLISGSGTNMAALIYASRLEGTAYEVVLVASNDPDAAGLTLAGAEGIPTFSLSHKGMDRDAHDTAMDDAIRRSGASHVALAGYMRVLGEAMVRRWEGRMLNIHPSLLPKYKGLDTHARALAAGDSHAGASVHLVTAELDGGDVLGQATVAILPGDTPGTLAKRVLIAEHQLYPRVLSDYVSRGRNPEWLTERVRERALALAEADEVLSHGMPCFGVAGGKKFAYVSNDHHGDGRIALLVKISGTEEQAMLIERDEERYYRPAYFGDGWVGIRLDLGDTDWDDIAARLEWSWRVSAPKRLTRLLGAVEQF